MMMIVMTIMISVPFDCTVTAVTIVLCRSLYAPVPTRSHSMSQGFTWGILIFFDLRSQLRWLVSSICFFVFFFYPSSLRFSLRHDPFNKEI